MPEISEFLRAFTITWIVIVGVSVTVIVTAVSIKVAQMVIKDLKLNPKETT